MAYGAPALVIVGHGPSGRGMVDEILRQAARVRVLVLDERPAGASSTPARWAAAGVEVHRGVRVSAVDPVARKLVAGGVAVSYDALVLATGSAGLAATARLPIVDGVIATDAAGRTGAAGVFAVGSCAAAPAELATAAAAVAAALITPPARFPRGSDPAIALPPADPVGAARPDEADPHLFGAAPPSDLSSLLVAAAASASAWSSALMSARTSKTPPRWRRG
jgi:hypothetical protein